MIDLMLDYMTVRQAHAVMSVLIVSAWMGINMMYDRWSARKTR